MDSPYANGQRVRFNKRCALAPNVPRHSQDYKYTALVLGEGDHYQGDGVIEPGTPAVIVAYASHGTGSVLNPIIRVKGKLVRVHQNHIDAL